MTTDKLSHEIFIRYIIQEYLKLLSRMKAIFTTDKFLVRKYPKEKMVLNRYFHKNDYICLSYYANHRP
jgi:hypothetical protein